MSYEEWMDKFHNEKVIDLKKELEDDDINILKQLNIFVKKELYTGSEFEQVMIDVGSYYRDDEMSDLELQYCNSLEDTTVSKEDYEKISKKIDEVLRKYAKVFVM